MTKRSHMFLLYVLVAVILPTVAIAQGAGAELEPKTRLEAFLTKTGRILVKVFHPLGSVPGTHGASAELNAVVLYEPGGEAQRLRGIKIEVTEAGGIQRKITSFVDMDEIEFLIKALNYMEKALSDWAASQEDYSEVIFSTKGGLSVGFYVQKGKAVGFIKSGSIGSATAFLQPQVLQTLREALTDGLSYLNAK